MKNINWIAFGSKLFGTILVVLLPIRSALIAAGILIWADFMSGVWASLKEGKSITSSGFRRTIMKILAYESAIIIAFIMEMYLLDGLPIVKVITGLIAVTEGKSFFENIARITGVNFWTAIISKLNMPDTKIKKDE